MLLLSAFMLSARTQVARLSNNTSYDWGFALTDNIIMLRSEISKTIWAYNISGNSFTQLSAAVTVDGDYGYGVLNGKLYFAGKTAAEGIELWVTDGTPGGTSMVKNINTGAADSEPKYGFVVYNSNIYFTANDGTTGRELWKSDGTGPGTVRVKDINTGAEDAFGGFLIPNYKVINNFLVFTAITADDGDELWRTDGTETGTIQLKDINTFPQMGSSISSFTEYGTNLIFTASDFLNDAIWKTDGTAGGTELVKDINPEDFPFTIFPPFFNFNDEIYFAGDDGTHGVELWKTNGTDVGTVLVKDIDPGFDGGGTPNNGINFSGLNFAVKNNSKFFFSATTAAQGSEIWESDGTGAGTVLLKDIAAGPTSSDIFILPDYFTNGLFQGNKFFFVANTPAKGYEYYVSDGTAGGTTILKDINPDAGNGFDVINLSYFYTGSKFYFVANNGTNGTEPWQTDGTTSGTTMIADVNFTPSPAENSDIAFTALASNTIFFFGTDGDHTANTDFFKLNESLPGSLPLSWVSIEARPYNDDVLLLWKTASEEQTDHFVVQRSVDGINYYDVGQVNANGGISNNYSYTDAGAMKQAGIKKWFYRVKYVDKDGKSAISRIVSVALNNPITQLRILPNPAVHELKLVIDAVSNDRAVIRGINVEGKIVLQRSIDIYKGENTVINDVRTLPNGIYLLQVTVDGSTSAKRFLIQR